MTVPGFQSMMLPLLKLAGDGNEHYFRDAIDALANQFNLSDSDRRELLPERHGTIICQSCWLGSDISKEGRTTSIQKTWILQHYGEGTECSLGRSA